jgi:hypothetical protein
MAPVLQTGDRQWAVRRVSVRLRNGPCARPARRRPCAQVALLSPFVQREVLRHGRGLSRSKPIPLPKQVGADVLKLLLEYCRFHQAPGRSDKVRQSICLLIYLSSCPVSDCRSVHLKGLAGQQRSGVHLSICWTDRPLRAHPT